MKKRILVVDDDHSMRSILQEAMTTVGYDVQNAKDGESALRILSKSEYDLVISDLMMPGINGIELMEKVRGIYPEIGFLIITAYGTIETAVKALHDGAYDFITKPFSISQIESRVKRFFSIEEIRSENKELRKKLAFDEKFVKLIGKSKSMEKIYHQIEVVAQSDVPVFIQGESGTGKELIAKEIHENSNRSGKKYLKINCSAIPETLFESTLFGHEKGSFTNAVKTHLGLFEEAHGGTLLLDEITEMPRTLQPKLLRVLQEGTITRVGSSKEISVDVRIVATSNRNINDLVKKEEFRSDLFFRLNVFPIKVEPLRTRREDIPLLVDHFIKKLRSKYHFKTKELDEKARSAFLTYSWPGNVRQIENLIERGILYSGENPVLGYDLFKSDFEENTSNDDLDTEIISIPEMEKKLIYKTLKLTNSNRTEAANLLGISSRTLRNKLHQYEDSPVLK